MLKKVFITTSLSILFLGFVLYNGWNLFKLNSGLKKVLVNKLQTAVGEECSVDGLRLGLGSIKLTGVSLAFQNSPYQVWIDELQLGYSLKSLFKGKGSLEKTAEEITLFRPRITLTYQPDQQEQVDVDLSLKLSNETEKLYRAIIKEYDFIKKITISEGEIVVLNAQTDNKTKIAKKINGWAYTDQDEQVWLRMAGHIFESDDYNTVLYGQFDLARGGLDFINLDLHDYKIGNEIPFLIPDYLDVQEGTVNGHLVITERQQPTRGFNIEGNIKLEGGRLKFTTENLHINNIAVNAEIKDWNLHLKKATQEINGSRTELSGMIRNLLEPQLDLTLTSSDLDVGEFLTQFFPDDPLHFRGTSQCSLAISETFDAPKVVGFLKSDSLWFHRRGIKELQVDLNFEERSFRFDSISGRMNGSSITGFGDIDFSRPDKWLDFKIHVAGDYTEYLHRLGLTASDSCFIRSDIVIMGPSEKPVSRGEFTVEFDADSVRTLTLNGSFNYSDGKAGLTVASDDQKFQLAASAEDIHHRPRVDIEANNLERVFKVANDSKLNFIRNRYILNLDAEGGKGDLYLSLDGHRRDNYEKIFRVETDPALSSIQNQIVGDVTLFPNRPLPVSGDFEVKLSQDRISLSKLYLGEWLEGRLDLSRKDLSPFDGRLSVQGLELALFLSMLGIHSDNFTGELYGQVMIDSMSDDSKFHGNLWLLDGFFREVGPLKGELEFAADASKLVFEKLSFEKTASSRVIAQGNLNLATRQIEATIAGSEVRIDEAIKIATGKEDIVQGTANLQVGLDGDLSQIPLTGRIEVINPWILMFDFDEAVFDFGSVDHRNGSYFSLKELMIGHAVLKRDQEFTLEGPAKLPISGDASLDVDLSGTGNFLTLLPNLADVFTESESSGRLDLRLAGRYNRPDFTGSKLICTDGKLKLSSVIDRIDDLEADLEVTEEDYFLAINKLQGKIKNAPFSISNTRVNPSTNGKQFEALRIAGDDLNLGALILRTSKAGVPLHIPALMEPGEVGWYQFRGLSSQEPFFVAGPWLRPHVRGEISVRNANLVFPFYEGDGEGSPIVQNIINSIDWDVRTVSEKDTRYVKQFSTAVYLNMEVDPENSALDFSGVLKDSTFRINGRVESTRGEFEYIDLNFRVEKFSAEFTRDSLYPIVSGKAWTVVRDSSNVPSDVYLTLYTVDDLNQEITKGRWDRLQIKLSSEYGGYGETQGQVMASLGYTSDNVEDQARKAVGYSTDKLLFRPIMRPLERQLERSLGLDVVRFSYAITRNFLDANFNNEQLRSTLALLRSSRLILGKYLTDDVYLLYTGELKAGIDYQFQNKGVGLQHILGLEYRLNSRWLFQMEYDYNTLLNTQRDDKKVWLRHSFPF